MGGENKCLTTNSTFPFKYFKSNEKDREKLKEILQENQIEGSRKGNSHG